MGIVIVRMPATPGQIAEMQAMFGDIVKSLELQSPAPRERFETIVRSLLEVSR